MRGIVAALGLVVLLAVGLMLAGYGVSVLGLLVEWARTVQASMQNDLVQAVRAWQAAPGLTSLLGMASVCFLYGVFHAVGPGHGKAVLSAYAATAQVRLRSVLALAALTAFVQATVAVLLVGIAFLGIGSGLRWATQQVGQVLEPLSYAAIALIGLWVLYGGVRRLWPRSTSSPHAEHDHDHAHEHHQHEHHDHHHEDHACCGHSHAPVITEDRRSGIALALAAGLRPCTGSLLVVGLCFGLGLWGMGIAASYAIGSGTAITVALLAGSVHAARGPFAVAGRLARVSEQTWSRVAIGLRLIGGAIILLLGGVLLQAALTAPRPPL
jgi:ABC-type nickel/cobalt efflux system permease component RcnA